MNINIFAFSDAFMLAREGKFSDDPKDPGGATYKGITLARLSSFENRACTIDDLKAMTEDTRLAICRSMFWRPLSCDDLPPAVAFMVYDEGFNDGPGNSARILQGILGVKQDGDIGPKTIAAVKAVADLKGLVNQLGVRQSARYATLPTFAHDGNGLLNRCADRLSAAIPALIGASP